jgi:hypothetical protein
MRWLALTAALLSASVALLAWVYLRDRHTDDWRPPERQLARADARAATAALAGASCHAGCAIELLAHTSSDVWLVRLDLRPRPQCLQIELRAFATGPLGLSGVWPARCPRRAQSRATSR